MSQQIIRKGFLKGALAGAAGIAAASMLDGCSTESPKTADSEAIETLESADILIIGGGMAGFIAGIHAMELGNKNVLIIDKASGEGFNWAGSSMVCGGSLLIPVSGSEADAKAYADALYVKALQKSNYDHLTTLANGAWESYQWILELGIQYGEPYSVFPAFPEVRTTVSSMGDTMTRLRDKYTEMNGRLLFNTKAVQLMYGGNGISGALVRQDDHYAQIKAKKTILCTGGYAANKEFLETHVGENGDEIMCRAREGCTGDGIAMAQAVGGYTVNSCGMRSIHLSAVDPVYKEKGQPGNDIPYMIAVNSEGRRFVDEALGSVRHGQAVFNQPVQKDGLIFDSKVLETVQATMDKLKGQGVITWKADTIEEMAGYFGVDAAALIQTVEEFNSHVTAEGTTEGLAVNKSAKALKIDTPPYYGIYPLVPGTSLTFGGLAISTNAEVLEPDGGVIQNLYACGEGTGGFFYDDYFGGSCLTRCAVYGRIAAKTAVESL